MKNTKCPRRKNCLDYECSACEVCEIGNYITKLSEKIKKLEKCNGELTIQKNAFVLAINTMSNPWIATKDAMPNSEEYDWVLCAVKTTEFKDGRDYYLVPRIAEYRNGDWWPKDGEFSLSELFEEVTHWAPLPTNPTEEKPNNAEAI